jgi:hypothetical protein
MAREAREMTRKMRFEPLEAVKQSVVSVHVMLILPILTLRA